MLAVRVCLFKCFFHLCFSYALTPAVFSFAVLLCFNECIPFPQQNNRQLQKLHPLLTHLPPSLHLALHADPAGALTSALTLSAFTGIHYLRKKAALPGDLLCVLLREWICHPRKNPSPPHTALSNISNNPQKEQSPQKGTHPFLRYAQVYSLFPIHVQNLYELECW